MPPRAACLLHAARRIYAAHSFVLSVVSGTNAAAAAHTSNVRSFAYVFSCIPD
jgi:hypothetical protein